MPLHLTRRRFIKSTAAVGTLAFASPVYRALAAEEAAAYYPPALIRALMGDNDGSQAAAHGVALRGKSVTLPATASEQYDLIIIGAGLSGLSAAYLYQKSRPKAKILILDAHQDFGGHAIRNEFRANGKLILGYGGSESIDSPKTGYSRQAKQILRDLGIDYTQFNRYFDQTLYEQKWGLKEGVFFDEASLGKNAVVAGQPETGNAQSAAVIAQFPLSDDDRAALTQLYTRPADYWQGKSRRARAELAHSTSYYDFLKNTAKLPQGALDYLTQISSEYWGISIHAISVYAALENGYPGVQNLKLAHTAHAEEPYIYHFPDGNASIARLLVRKLIPSIAAGHSMEDIVTAQFDYSKLDLPANNVRIRLNSTALIAQNTAQGVAVAYQAQGSQELQRADAAKCIFAGHSALAARIMPDMPAAQKTAEQSNSRTPMVYANALVKNAHAFKKLGVHRLYAPTAFFCDVKLDDPVSIGDYQCTQTPDEPIVIHMAHIATALEGKTPQEMYKKGRGKLAGMTFDDIKAEMLKQLRAIYALAGENLDDNLLDVSINRWSHGYSYERLDLFNTGRNAADTTAQMQKRVGNIFMAGSDVAWKPYVQGAFDQAYRAVKEALA
ncbi:NAD(P)-binding protein [Kingella sp. (in: b-proteobacteria)]|uniref:NAD(P)-binding protein n=1 Tax=Kingella sp. (in: b-proteobacteria) TaxID=2020713 RepID=UPI0026DA770C|nr:NAD(P)-binding protein [Kingella sp. (in: b-proteobacteria)]MDO4656432.1 NAD(P)-binding protein [Kingella sp. (in: b-proteobacteria)]